MPTNIKSLISKEKLDSPPLRELETQGFATLAHLAPEVDKTIARSIDLETFWAWLQEIDKVITRSIDLETLWAWLQKSTKA